ncbi:MAG: FAD-dependent thymidylate synthase [bacterium]
MSETFTKEEIAILQPYVSNTDKPIFVLKNLPEEVVAVLFAYYSRSKGNLRRNLLKLIQDQQINLTEEFVEPSRGEHELALAREEARQFHERWVVGYGHASVAEHAVAHIAIEDVSIIASKIIEDMRLASYTEKSTRYVIFGENHYYRPPELISSEFRGEFEKTMQHLFRTYIQLTETVIEKIKKQVPKPDDMTEERYHAACRAKACDILRYILPAATYTNVGMTINGRALEYLLIKMLSHPLGEVQETANLIKQEALTVIPTLIKYADYNKYKSETEKSMRRIGKEFFNAAEDGIKNNQVRLVRYVEDAEDQLVAAILFGYVQNSYEEVRKKVDSLSTEEKQKIIDEYLKRRGKWDQPLRALEHIYYTFDILIDFGAFRDVQRHRMATQTSQLLTNKYGYSTPPEIIEFGNTSQFNECMERAGGLYERIAPKFPYEAQYVLPLAYRKRVLFTWNLRELHHFISLRSSKEGHISYRNIAQQVYKELERVHPFLAKYVRVDMSQYDMARL